MASTSGGASTAWIWILVALVVVGGIATVLIVRRRRRAAHEAWAQATSRAVAEGKAVVDQLRHGVAESADIEPAVQRQLQALDSTLAAVESSAPSPEARRDVTDGRAAVADLSDAVESDLRLRVGPPPPTPEQLHTSQGVIDERVLNLDHALDRLARAPAPAS